MAPGEFAPCSLHPVFAGFLSNQRYACQPGQEIKMTLAIQQHMLETNQIAINYAEIDGPTDGPGPALVLLHGGSARWQSFSNILPDLAELFHIYAPDFRGHGYSSWVPDSYRLQDYADDTITFLQSRLTEPAYLFGHSLGGMVALLVAAQYPAGVRAVAVGDAPLSAGAWQAVLDHSRDRLVERRDQSGGQKSVPELIEILKESPVEQPGQAEPVPLQEVMGPDSPVFAWLAINMVQNDPDMLSAVLDRFEATAAGYDMPTVLPAIQCPVLLMQADPAAGGLMTDSDVNQALSLLTHGSHVKLAGLSHALHGEQKEPVVEALKAFQRGS